MAEKDNTDGLDVFDLALAGAGAVLGGRLGRKLLTRRPRLGPEGLSRVERKKFILRRLKELEGKRGRRAMQERTNLNDALAENKAGAGPHDWDTSQPWRGTATVGGAGLGAGLAIAASPNLRRKK